MGCKTFALATREDLLLSGPHVWPRITADEVVDRLIHRRPEIMYLESIRRLTKRRKSKGPAEEIGIRLARIYKILPRARMQTFTGYIHTRLDDDVEDVRLFLSELRGFLKRGMPEDPTPSLSAAIIFHEPGKSSPALCRWEETWI